MLDHRINWRGRRAGGLDRLARGETEILAITRGHQLHADRNPPDEPRGDDEPRKAHERDCDLRQLRVPHPRERRLVLAVEMIRERQLAGHRHQQHRIFVEEGKPFARQRGAAGQRLRQVERMHP